MSSVPTYAGTPNVGTANLGTAETEVKPPQHAVLLLTAGANGSKIEEIIVEAVAASLTPTSTASLVYLYMFDGTSYWLRDVLQVTAVAASATVLPFRLSKMYTNLWLKAGQFLYASMSAAQGTGTTLDVTAQALDA